MSKISFLLFVAIAAAFVAESQASYHHVQCGTYYKYYWGTRYCVKTCTWYARDQYGVLRRYSKCWRWRCDIDDDTTTTTTTEATSSTTTTTTTEHPSLFCPEEYLPGSDGNCYRAVSGYDQPTAMDAGCRLGEVPVLNNKTLMAIGAEALGETYFWTDGVFNGSDYTFASSLDLPTDNDGNEFEYSLGDNRCISFVNAASGPRYQVGSCCTECPLMCMLPKCPGPQDMVVYYPEINRCLRTTNSDFFQFDAVNLCAVNEELMNDNLTILDFASKDPLGRGRKIYWTTAGRSNPNLYPDEASDSDALLRWDEGNGDAVLKTKNNGDVVPFQWTEEKQCIEYTRANGREFGEFGARACNLFCPTLCMSLPWTPVEVPSTPMEFEDVADGSAPDF